MTVPVTAVALYRVRLPLHRPHVAAHGREDRREVIVVEVADGDGTTGWGECPALSRPGYSPETLAGAWRTLNDRLVPALLGAGEGPLPGAPMATGAVADAVLDLRVRRGEVDLPVPARERVPFGVAVGMSDDIEEVVSAARAAVAAGAGLVVLKVRPGWSVEPLAAVRDEVGGAVAVDANGSFTASDLDEFRRMAAAGPVFVEQPAPAGDPTLSARFQALADCPVALDEAVVDRASLEVAVAARAATILTVKASRLGGFAAATDVADRAVAAGWRIHVGGMLESGLGRAVARRLAVRVDVAGPGLVGPTGLLFGDDLVDPVAATDRTVPVPTGPGLAPAPDRDRLDALTVERRVHR